MTGYIEIDVDELFPSDDSMTIVVTQPKPLTIVPPKELAVVLPKTLVIMPLKEIMPNHPQSFYAQATPMLHLSPSPSRLSIE